MRRRRLLYHVAKMDADEELDGTLGRRACTAFDHSVDPEPVLWRPALSLVLMAATIVASMIPAFWGWPLIVAWVATPVFVCDVLAGVLTETRVSTHAWAVCRWCFLALR
jgi:hypothetical protein